MKIQSRFDNIEVDLTTPEGRKGNTAVLQAKDEGTLVSYGGLHASVDLLDLKLRIIMDPHEGPWDDLGWARNEAWHALKEELTAGDLCEIMRMLYQRGSENGERKARMQIRAALGIEED